MCQFFSCVSDGNGKVSFFKPEDVVSIMASGNPESYDFNSHTSLMSFLGIKAKDEDKMNKWEYRPEKKELIQDTYGVCADDRKEVLKVLEEFFNKKDLTFLANLYGRNSGYGNSGNGNSGDRNSGNRNSGDRNSGYGNSGNRNSGDGNSGYGNSGYGNSGNRNSGNRNSGDGNSGNGNSGYGNSGNGNSGDGNSGDGNSGYRNSGNGNSGDGSLNTFCSKQSFILFNGPCTKEEYGEIYKLDWGWFAVTKWIALADMTKAEKEAYPFCETTDGYLKTIPYKEAWEKCPKKFIKEVKKLKNFDADVFKEITGLKV